MSGGPLAFFHTAATQVSAFEELLRERAPSLRARHAVLPALLAEARATAGITPSLRAQVQAAAAELLREGARVVVCTCSTLGGCAEDAGAALGAPVLRIDRPMAEQAVGIGAPILVVAALESTLAPTLALLHDTAERRGLAPELRTLLCDAAWPHFEAGDRSAYHDAIAAAIRAERSDARVVVLAQASMEGTETRLADLDLQVLSSPRSGLAAALARLAIPQT